MLLLIVITFLLEWEILIANKSFEWRTRDIEVDKDFKVRKYELRITAKIHYFANL